MNAYHWLGIEAEPPGQGQPIADIIAATGKHFRVTTADMLSARRTQDIVRPRQIAMYIARHLTSRSLACIGRRFGDRDHATVIHAVKRIEALRAEEHEIDAAVTGIMAGLAG